MTKSGCQGEMPYAQCIIVDEIMRVNMHQRLYLQCGRGLNYHAKRKNDHGLIRKIFFSLPDPKDNDIKGEITQSGHRANVSALHDGCIHY